MREGDLACSRFGFIGIEFSKRRMGMSDENRKTFFSTDHIYREKKRDDLRTRSITTTTVAMGDGDD